jgi:hypothetical protein
MKTMTTRSRSFSRLHAKTLVALITTSVVCGLAGISLMPAHAEGNDQRDEHPHKADHKDQGHRDREDHDRNGRGHEEPRFYPQPIYAPPAVYYPPQQSPGISLFLPLDIHVR